MVIAFKPTGVGDFMVLRFHMAVGFKSGLLSAPPAPLVLETSSSLCDLTWAVPTDGKAHLCGRLRSR